MTPGAHAGGMKGLPMPNPLPRHARPEEALLWFNGLDGRQGSYLLPPVPPRHLADLACGATVDQARIRELQAWVARGEGKARRGLRAGTTSPAKARARAGSSRREPSWAACSAPRSRRYPYTRPARDS